jgi:outer membrane lipoprotein carrier protein
MYDPDLKQLSKQKIEPKQNNNPVSLLSGSTVELQKNFNINYLQKTDSDDWFKLQPKTEDDIFHYIILQFSQGTLKSMYIVDNLGQQTNIVFTNVEINLPLDKKTFIFVPPHGVDVDVV